MTVGTQRLFSLNCSVSNVPANLNCCLTSLSGTNGLDVPIVRGAETLPWSGLLAQLLLWRVQLIGWPESVPFPTETIKRTPDGHARASQGIKDLPSEPVRAVLSSFTDPKTRIKINKNMLLRGEY
jgi:hypothetical protein